MRRTSTTLLLLVALWLTSASFADGQITVENVYGTGSVAVKWYEAYAQRVKKLIKKGNLNEIRTLFQKYQRDSSRTEIIRDVVSASALLGCYGNTEVLRGLADAGLLGSVRAGTVGVSDRYSSLAGSALDGAMRCGSGLTVLSSLLSIGADPNFHGSFWNYEPLNVNLSINGQNPLERKFEEGPTPLYFAIAAGNSAAVQLLLEHGADPRLSFRVPKGTEAFRTGLGPEIDQVIGQRPRFVLMSPRDFACEKSSDMCAIFSSNVWVASDADCSLMVDGKAEGALKKGEARPLTLTAGDHRLVAYVGDIIVGSSVTISASSPTPLKVTLAIAERLKMPGPAEHSLRLPTPIAR
jgi:hypothetical protein